MVLTKTELSICFSRNFQSFIDKIQLNPEIGIKTEMAFTLQLPCDCSLLAIGRENQSDLRICNRSW